MIKYNLKQKKLDKTNEFVQFNTKKVANTIVLGIAIENYRTNFINNLFEIIDNNNIKPVLTLRKNIHNKIYFLIYYQSENLYINKYKRDLILFKKLYFQLSNTYKIFLNDSRGNNIISINGSYSSKLHKNPYYCLDNEFNIYNNNIKNLLSKDIIDQFNIDSNLLFNHLIDDKTKIDKNITLYKILWNKAIYMLQRNFYTKMQLQEIATHIKSNIKISTRLKMIILIDSKLDHNYFKNPEYIKSKNKKAYQKRRLIENRKNP